MSFRVSLGAALLVASGCGPVIVLGDTENPVCLGLGCGGVGQSGGPGSGGTLAGAVAQAGVSAGGSAGSGGGVPSEGGASGGQGGEGPIAPGCQPAATDEVCNGLDAACEPVLDDAGCSDTCEGSFLNGTSYMSCLAAADFDGAEAACREHGMHLVKIDSAAENATVLGLALDDYVWIGGSNRDDASVYVWLDGTRFYDAGAPVGMTYQNFGDSEPSGNDDLRCVQQRELGGGTWSMWGCSGEQSFVCERYEF